MKTIGSNKYWLWKELGTYKKVRFVDAKNNSDSDDTSEENVKKISE